jgi:hypothetical protein
MIAVPCFVLVDVGSAEHQAARRAAKERWIILPHKDPSTSNWLGIQEKRLQAIHSNLSTRMIAIS